MKILHITAIARLNGNSGIPAVLKALSDEQNKIEGVEARVMSLCASVEMMNSGFFEYVEKDRISDFLISYQPDLAIFHSFYHLEYARVARLLKVFRIPFILEPHGAFGPDAMKKSKWKKFIADKTVFRSLLKDSVAYIYTNKAEMETSVYPKAKSCIIPNGVFVEVVKGVEAKQKPVQPVFYFLGRYDINHKGLDFLLDALQILDERKEKVTVRLYGTGNEEQTKYIHERISKFQIINVCDKGTIYGDAKKEALQEVNILMLTSRYEGSPMTILDALSYGNPCLVTPGTNVSEEIVDNKLGWKVDLDAASIADGMERAVKEYMSDAKGYYERCQHHVLNNYIWSDIAKRSVVEYTKMIG